MNQTKLWSYDLDCGSAGRLMGLFLATDQELQAAEGKDLYFGYVLGKHGEVSARFDLADVTLRADNPIFIAQAKEYGIVPFGYDPLFYLCEEEAV